MQESASNDNKGRHFESKINQREKKLTIIWICVAIDNKSTAATDDEHQHQHQPWIHRHLFLTETIFSTKKTSNPESKINIQ